MSLRTTLLVIALLALPLAAQEGPPRLLHWSAAAMIAATSLDFASSVYDANTCQRLKTCHESNGLLTNSAGKFSAGRALAVKAGFTGGILVAEALLARRHPKLIPAFAIVNFSDAAIYGVVGARNFQLGR